MEDYRDLRPGIYYIADKPKNIGGLFSNVQGGALEKAAIVGVLAVLVSSQL